MNTLNMDFVSICQEYLRNSDLYVELTENFGSVELVFISGIKQVEVRIKARDILEYRFVKVPIDCDAPYFVDYVTIQQLDILPILESYEMFILKNRHTQFGLFGSPRQYWQYFPRKS